jgi:hypothetical protein
MALMFSKKTECKCCRRLHVQGSFEYLQDDRRSHTNIGSLTTLITKIFLIFDLAYLLKETGHAHFQPETNCTWWTVKIVSLLMHIWRKQFRPRRELSIPQKSCLEGKHNKIKQLCCPLKWIKQAVTISGPMQKEKYTNVPNNYKVSKAQYWRRFPSSKSRSLSLVNQEKIGLIQSKSKQIVAKLSCTVPVRYANSTHINTSDKQKYYNQSKALCWKIRILNKQTLTNWRRQYTKTLLGSFMLDGENSCSIRLIVNCTYI